MILVKSLNVNNVGIPPKGQLSLFRAKDGDYIDQLVALHDDGSITPVSISDGESAVVESIESYADNAAAIAGGLTVGKNIYYDTTARAILVVQTPG